MFKNKRVSHIFPETRVGVLEVKSGEKDEVEKEEKEKKNNIMNPLKPNPIKDDGQPHAANTLFWLYHYLLDCRSHPCLLI